MEKQEFEQIIIKELKPLEIELSTDKVDKFYNYMNLLIEWNEKINLTAITEPKEIIIKHFVDSLTINKYIEKQAKVIDVGTGAGFPGIPLKILRDDIEVTLMDSLNKRILFLEDVIEKMKLEKVKCIHSRAEDGANMQEYREKYDIVVSRAVANMSTLIEYMSPFNKVGGKTICMKGSNIQEELKEAEKAIAILGGKVEKIDSFNLPNTDMQRNIVIINKVVKTPKQYPRKQGKPSKEPIK